MAMALMAWLMAPAPMACTSTRCWVRTTPAMAPATATGLLVAETLRISNCGSAPWFGTREIVCEDEDIIGPIVAERGAGPGPPRCNRYVRPPRNRRFRG